jgi:hypothetical protein
MMDREPLSPTAGCCDRTFWAWKFVDFPGARFQEALCVLGFLHATDFPGNWCAGNPALLQWIDRAMQYWCGLQHGDGSFDEAYPYERSLAATSFTTFYVGEALGFVGDQLPPETSVRVHGTIRAAAEWLTRNDETHGFLSNHLAAAAGALQHAYRLTGDGRFQDRYRYFLDRILSHQSSEGWYEEYGGADPGYQTHGSFYLARCWQLTDDDTLAASLEEGMRFIAHFVHPDGSFSGEYASRNTKTYYPAACEMLANRDSVSAWIADTMRPSLSNGATAALRGIDRYNYFPFLNNFIFAHLAGMGRTDDGAEAPDPTPGIGQVDFAKAGIVRIRRSRYDAFVGTAKGGVLKVFDRARRRLIFSDCGYVATLDNGRLLATQYDDLSRPTTITPERIVMDGALIGVSRPTMTPPRFIAFRGFTLTVGRMAWLAQWLKRYLVKVLIYRRRPTRVNVRRSIEFTEDSITVRDELRGPDGGRVRNLQHAPQFATVHMGSSRYFVANELNVPMDPSPVDVQPGAIEAGLVVERTVRVDGEEH